MGEVKPGVLRPFEWPAADPDWHDGARRIYESLPQSGQSFWYQASDAAYAHFMCGEISHYLYSNPNRRSSQMLASLLVGLNQMMLTEAERRRARIELEPQGDDQSNPELALIVDMMDQARGRKKA